MPCGEYFTNYGKRDGLIRWRTEWIALVVGLPIPFLLPFYIGYVPLIRQALVEQLFIIILAVIGLNIVVGYAGELIFAQGAIMAIGAYSAINLLEMGVGLIPTAIIGGLLAAIVVFLTGLPAGRLHGFYMAITTFALQFIIEWFISTGEFEWLTGGSQQTAPFEITLLPGFGTIQQGSNEFYYVILAFMLIGIVASMNLRRTSIGRSFVAIRENDYAANVIGVNSYKFKLIAFFIGGFFIGVAGVLWMFQTGVAEPESYSLVVTIEHYIMLLFGGLGRTWGVILGSSSILFIEEFVHWFALNVVTLFVDYAFTGAAFIGIVYGTIIIVVLIYEPNGIMAMLGKFKEYLRRWPFEYELDLR